MNSVVNLLHYHLDSMAYLLCCFSILASSSSFSQLFSSRSREAIERVFMLCGDKANTIPIARYIYIYIYIFFLFCFCV